MNIEDIANLSEVDKLSFVLGPKHLQEDYAQVHLACEKILKHIESDWSEEQTSIFFKAVSKYLQDVLVHQSISDMPHTITNGLDNLTPIIESAEEEYDIRFEF